jgi:enoyl-CoA hydratase
MNNDILLVDAPRPLVRRLTLNRPEKRNPLSNELRGKIFAALYEAENDSDVRVIVIRGAGSCFSAGYDLSKDSTKDIPWHLSKFDGNWAQHVIKGWFEMWDLAKPIIAQVHGYCLAGGTELASACDLVYVAEDAQIGYPPVRLMSSPDMVWQPWLLGMRRAMEAMLTGDAMSGTEAVQAGFANRAFPADKLDQEVLAIAERVAKVPSDIQFVNKRVVHRSMEIMGIRTAIRTNTDLYGLARHQPSSKEYFAKVRENLNKALKERDQAFGDYGKQKNHE